MPAPLTADEIRAAYRTLYMATANAMDAQRPVTQAKRVLADFDAVAWPGGNETERKAAKMQGTLDARETLAAAEDALAAAEREQALAKLVVAKLHDMLRLAEYEQQDVDLSLTRVGLRELPALLKLAEAMEDKPDTKSDVYITPPHIADFAAGSGAYLAAAEQTLGNPPYEDATVEKPIDK